MASSAHKGSRLTIGYLTISDSANDMLFIQSNTGGAGNKSSINFLTYSGNNTASAQIAAVEDSSFGAHIAFSNMTGAKNTALSEKMRITNSGNVGIGQTNPTFKLDVSGTIRATGVFTSTVANGTAPLSITSSSNVANLNASYLSDKRITDFVPVAVTSETQPSTGLIEGMAWHTSSNGNTYFYLNGSFKNMTPLIVSPQEYVSTPIDGSINIPIGVLLTVNDSYEVHVDGIKMYAGINYVTNPDNASIDLIGWAANGANQFMFSIYKSTSGYKDLVDASLISANSITNNQLYTDIKIGSLATLTTAAKSSVTASINEVDSNVNTVSSNVGTLTSLTTSTKTSIVAALNEVDTNTNTNSGNIGTLSGLSTTTKTSIVASINELVQKQKDLEILYWMGAI